MTAPQKKFDILDMTVTEVSTVDVPAQKGAVAVIMKRDGDGVNIRKNASEVATGQAAPLYKAAEYADAIMVRAEEIAERTGTTASKALLDHSATDPVIIELSFGERAAEMAAMRAKQSARFEKVDRFPSIPQRGHMTKEPTPVSRECMMCAKSFETTSPDRRMCEKCRA